MQHYAWKNLKINSRRRLVAVGDQQLEAVDTEPESVFDNSVLPRNTYASFDDDGIYDDEATLDSFDGYHGVRGGNMQPYGY